MTHAEIQHKLFVRTLHYNIHQGNVKGIENTIKSLENLRKEAPMQIPSLDAMIAKEKANLASAIHKRDNFLPL